MDDLVQQVVEKAERACAQLKERSDDSMDYTEASLSIVEDMLMEASQYVSEMDDGQVGALVQLLGSYVLEVGRREFGGTYLWHDKRQQPVLVVGEPSCKIAILTFDKVRGRLSGDTADNIPFFYAGFATCARRAEPGIDILYA
jgi:hypothetical protein